MSLTQTLEYNGVQLRDCQTLKFSEEPVLGPDHSLIGMKRVLRVLGYYSGDPTAVYPQMGDPDSASVTPGYMRRGAAQHYNYLKDFLLTPRRRFRFWADALPFNDPDETPGGTDPKEPFLLFDVIPFASIRDSHDLSKIDPKNEINDGPTPKDAQITNLASNSVWRVEFEIEWTVAAFCPVFEPTTAATELDPNQTVQSQFPDSGGLLPEVADLSESRAYGVRSHSWTCTEDIDSNFFATRTYNGELRLSNPNFNPHDFRYLCRPPLTVGARRKSIMYSESEDKLTLRYTIVDEEIVTAAPARFTGLAIKHTEVAEKWGATVKVNLDVLLQGDRFANRFDMMAYVCAIIDYKLYIRDQAAGQQGFRLLVDRVELSTAEGTDKELFVSAKVTGERFVNKNAVANLGNNQNNNNVFAFGFMNQRQFTRLPDDTFANVPGAPPYNNSLSRGINNDGNGWTKPDITGGLSLTTVWHAYVTEPCTEKMSFTDNADWTTNDLTRRTTLRDAIQTEAEDTWNQAPVGYVVPDTPLLPYTSLAGLSDAHDAAIYTVYDIQSHYYNDAMSIAMPSSVTSSSNIYTSVPATSFVRLAPNQWMRKINITAERYGLPPRIPTMDDTYTETKKNAATSQDVVKAKLLRATVSPCAPKLAVHSAGRIYSIDAEYVYALDAEPKNMKLGIPDFEQYASETDVASVPAFTTDFANVASSATWGVEV